MDAFGVLGEVLADYRSFVTGFLDIKDVDIRVKVESEIDDGLLWPEPWLALNPAFESGGSVTELVAQAVLHPGAAGIFRVKSAADPVGSEITFHRHQAEAFTIAGRGESYVLTTGTGSGKSMAYIVPIVDRVLREGSGKGVRAIVVYPMNALANSQLDEMRKFLGEANPKVSFRRYTGQESRAEREEILASPPDVLLTNYVMLELMLTRPQERKRLIGSAKNLSFLVLDELHTYRGRQGADVAMLVRRLRTAVAAEALQCIGTSATLAGPGSKTEQRAQVAELATKIFGVPIAADNVVGETLRRATSGDVDTAALTQRLGQPTPQTWEALRTDPLAVWAEEQFGLLTDEDGKLARRAPTRLSAVAEELSHLTGVDVGQCQDHLRELLLAGSRARSPQGRSLFAFKLHQFIGKGDTVYTTLEPAASRHLTTQYQRSAPNRPGGQPLFPLAFCRECGQDFVVVNQERGGEHFTPRPPNTTADEEAQATGLLYLCRTDWPDLADPALLDLVPEDWVTSQGGAEVLDPARRNKLPAGLRVDKFGTVTDDGIPVAFFERLDFCPACKTSYESTRASEFSRVASLGTEGRASAVTVLSQSVVRALRGEADLDDEARKFLAFSDNRQDASLQAGHFNDFVLVALTRSALYRAAAEHHAQTGEPLTDETLGPKVVTALGGEDRRLFARDESTADELIPRKKIAAALRDVITYRLWRDLARGWRITMPNLEQTGQLRMRYEGLRELAAEDAKWSGRSAPLVEADADTRHRLMDVLLDELRRHLCIETEFLSEEKFDAIKRASREWLKDPWSIAEETGTYSGVAYPGPRPKNLPGVGADLHLSGLGAYGRWLRRPNQFPAHPGKLKTADADALIIDLLETLADAGILARVNIPKRPTGYRIYASLIQWHPGDGQHRTPDPIRGNQTEGRINPYFRDLYAQLAQQLVGLEAREHTAQVEPKKRREREIEFGSAKLPVLYCSPTMELGVDINSLNAVGMRNVPPTPANYAQRSGRAGRSGQPAIAVTYCANGNAHDAYYFRRSRDMVAGAVAPPRLELGNQDLVRAHAHAIWLVCCDLDLKASMVDLLDIDQDGQPLRPEVVTHMNSPASRAAATTAISEVLTVAPEVTSAPWWTPTWIADTVAAAPARFDAAADRWRGLYREAQIELDHANDTLKTIGASEPSKQRARGRISEARAALDLLKGQVDDVSQGDFYTYRYFASEGFLPGYSFPRLPLAAFIPAQRRTRFGEGDFIQRPRFLAISEFGPGAFIYHEGARYQVDRVSLPAREDGSGVHISEIKRCNHCGYLHESNTPTSVTHCQHCGTSDLDVMTSMMRLLSVKTRRRDRISADEEERQRVGHEILTAIRFVPHGQRAGQLPATITATDGNPLGTLTYGDTALIRRMNIGPRRRKDKDVRGHVLDTVDGRWCKESDLAKNTAGEAEQYTRVIPYVEDHRNALVLHLDPSIPPEQRMAVMYGLKRGIETVYQLEDSELAAEPLPGRVGDQGWSRLLFFEAAEGGAGVLRRLATEDGQLRIVARQALELLHFDPDSAQDLRRAPHAREDCEQACYDCLLSYANQWDHQDLDRHNVVGLLRELAAATVTVDGADEDRAAVLQRLKDACDSDLERHFLDLLDEHGYRLPDEAQKIVEGYYVRPDFAYHVDGMSVAVFIDGPAHDSAHQQEKDEQARAKLEDEAGWLVLRFHHSTDNEWPTVFAEQPAVFGPGKTQP